MNHAAEIQRWWPGARVWYGARTSSWWAFVPGRPDRLVEARDPKSLARAMAGVAGGLPTASR